MRVVVFKVGSPLSVSWAHHAPDIKSWQLYSFLKMKNLRVMTGPFDVSSLNTKRGWRLSGALFKAPDDL
jgi:hypothetical protein